jgi:hypothetical protein
MKLSISVPDDLWAEAAPADSSPSEVVQQALADMVSRRKPKSPWGRAPEPGVVEEYKESLDAVVHRLLSERKKLRSDGYRVGAVLAADTSMDLGWFMASVARLNPELLRAYITDAIAEEDPNEDLAKRIISLASDVAQLEAEWVGGDDEDPEDFKGGHHELPQEFLAGLVDALFDIWDVVERESSVSVKVSW